MANSRNDILRALRAAHVPPKPLPDLPTSGVQYPDVHAQFAKSLTDVGGRCIFAGSDDIENALSRLPEYETAARVLSLVPGVNKANVNLDAIIVPTELEDIDVCVLPGQLGVAENGAVWVVEDGFPFRAGWYLAQHMVLVLRADTIVHNMHEAYERIHVGTRGFSTFISGPSKTADIEQSLVIGAQGPRSCTALVV
ncbi:LUD domain-containing protein [Pendulispora rubella]|uniref:LUD domain-containing protein n=1 Tax=Pendulispora rubella TaxID=2741070 RepID=A0ABZ2KXW0_9BACT